MARWRDVTIGDLADSLWKYRPFLLTLVGVLFLAVVLPGANRSDDQTEHPDAAAAGARPATEAAQAIAQEATSDAGSYAPGEEAAGGGAATGARGAVQVGKQATAPALRQLGGVAQSAPDCDPLTGRIRVNTNSFVTAADIIPAPNCVPMWPKGADNGGATHRGVTKDTITVAAYQGCETANTQQAGAILNSAGVEDPTSDEEDDVNREKVNQAFAAHFETYGRKVKWVKVECSGTDDAAAKADALRVAEEVKAFASFGAPQTNAYIGELAARGVMCIVCTPTMPQKNFDRWAPHVFDARMSADEVFMGLSRFTAGGLGKKPAKWSGDPIMQARNRTWGLFQYNTPDHLYDGAAQTLDSMMQKFGEKIRVTLEYLLDLPNAQEQARTMIARMKDAGVTSIMCYCDPLTPVFFTQEATRQQYFPEWIISGSIAVDWVLFARTYDQLQWQHAFGIAIYPGRADPAVTEAEGNLITWHYGEALESYPNYLNFGLFYTGVHLAGPKLSPATFRDGMFSLKPVSGFLSRPAVSYGASFWPWRDYHAIDDMGLLWWDPNSQGPDELNAHGQGMYRYVDRGKRYLPFEIPLGEPKMFDKANTETYYLERPAQDKLPVYEHKDVRGK